MKKTYKFFLLLPLAAFMLVGCETMTHDQMKGKVDMPAPVAGKPEFIFHRVMAGETMATIAKWYSGKDSMWRELAEHNPGMSPWNLKKNDIVKVPVSMATFHTEQPNYSTAPRKKVKKAAGATATPQTEGQPTVEEEEPVFGPK